MSDKTVAELAVEIARLEHELQEAGYKVRDARSEETSLSTRLSNTKIALTKKLLADNMLDKATLGIHTGVQE